MKIGDARIFETDTFRDEGIERGDVGVVTRITPHVVFLDIYCDGERCGGIAASTKTIETVTVKKAGDEI